jgi:hypothetical protein
MTNFALNFFGKKRRSFLVDAIQIIGFNICFYKTILSPILGIIYKKNFFQCNKKCLGIAVGSTFVSKRKSWKLQDFHDSLKDLVPLSSKKIY